MQVAVIGSGVIGLSTGILLLKAGYEVTIYSKAHTPYLTSDVACAQWLPHETSDTGFEAPDYNKKLLQWCRDSWAIFAELQRVSSDRYGIRWGTNFELFHENEEVPKYILDLADLMPNFEIITGESFPGGCTTCCKFDTFIIETPIYMPRIHQDFLDGGGKIVTREFQKLNEILQLDEKVVFNCTGLGAKDLFHDEHLKGIKGQLLLHEPIDTNMMIGLGDFCLIPRSDALILGSLHEEDYADEGPTHENDQLLWDTITSWFESLNHRIPIDGSVLSRKKIIRSISGIRPGRSVGVRVEVEIQNGKLLIHNYGHGGGGITLSWGCAKYAIDLLEATKEVR